MEEKQNTPLIVLQKGGPLRITGNFTISDEKNQQIDSGTEIFLCRCGNSKNKPYCDGSHKSNHEESSASQESCD